MYLAQNSPKNRLTVPQAQSNALYLAGELHYNRRNDSSHIVGSETLRI